MELRTGLKIWRKFRAAAFPARCRSALSARSLGLVALGIVVLGLVVTDHGSGEAVSLSTGGEVAPASQLPGLEPAFLTLINVSDEARFVRVESVDGSGGSRLEFVPVAGVRTFEMNEGFEPSGYQSSCVGCATVFFSLAAGQRIIVYVVEAGDALAERSDLRIVNESGTRQTGLLRTGAAFGEGRIVLRFDLRDGEEAAVGIRLNRNDFLDLNVSCNACLPHLIRVHNGHDLEIPLS